MNTSEKEIIGMRYEHFLKRNLNNRYRRPHKSEIINLIKTENGQINTSLGSYLEQLGEIKKRMLIALDNLEKHDGITSENEKSVLLFKEQILNAHNAYDIYSILDKCNELTNNVIQNP